MFLRFSATRRWVVSLAASIAAVAAITVAVPRAGAAKHPTIVADALPYENASLPVSQRVADLLSRMTLAEKVGQMTQGERAHFYPPSGDPSQITSLGLGSVLSGGGSVPTPNTPSAWADMVDRFQRAAMATRLHIPLIYGIDTVHGDGNMYGATVFPHNIGLGASRDPQLVYDVEHVAAEETRASGPQWVFAPCLCAARDDRWGRTYESFGEDPSLVAQMETAIAGFQGAPGQLGDRDRVLATAKHFAGDGDTTYGTGNKSSGYPIDQGIDITTHADFARVALSQYVPAIHKYDVGSVMPSYSSVEWTDGSDHTPTHMTADRDLIQGWLKDQQHFSGFVISDYNAIDQLPGDFATQVATAVNAGVDMFMQPDDYAKFITTLEQDYNDGRVSMARIDDAVSRILAKKFELGLFEHPYTDRTNIGQIGSPAHHALARRAAAESAVLLRNERHTLPVRGATPVYVAGSNADSIGNQAGGWTLTWQGGMIPREVPGTTILDGIKQDARGPVTYSENASAPIPHNAMGVVVVGETPYSEGFGDVGGPQWAYDPSDHGVPRPPKTMMFSSADSHAIDTVCAQARRCVVVVVSGRPMIIDPAQLSRMDGLVAAWLPGSEGAGIADDLFGRHAFSGKLPVTWPRSLSQEPINVGDANYHPLYPFGYGLTTRVSGRGGAHHGRATHGGRTHGGAKHGRTKHGGRARAH